MTLMRRCEAQGVGRVWVRREEEGEKVTPKVGRIPPSREREEQRLMETLDR